MGVDCALDDARNLEDLSSVLPSSEGPSTSWSNLWPIVLLWSDGLRTAEVSMVMVGARGLLVGPGEVDALPAGGAVSGCWSAIFECLADAQATGGAEAETPAGIGSLVAAEKVI